MRCTNLLCAKRSPNKPVPSVCWATRWKDPRMLHSKDRQSGGWCLCVAKSSGAGGLGPQADVQLARGAGAEARGPRGGEEADLQLASLPRQEARCQGWQQRQEGGLENENQSKRHCAWALQVDRISAEVQAAVVLLICGVSHWRQITGPLF